jgi:hypothetical protein
MLCDISSTRAGADGSHRAEPSHGQAPLDELVEHCLARAGVIESTVIETVLETG